MVHGTEPRPWPRDALLALVLVVATLVNSANLYLSGPAQQKQVLPYFGDVAGLHRALVVWWLFGALIVAGILILHRWPLAALALVGVGGIGHQFDARFAVQPLDIAVPIALYVVASTTGARWVSWVALGTSAIAVYLVRLRDGSTAVGKLPLPNGAPSIVDDSVATSLTRAATSSLDIMLVLVLAVVIGDSVRSRRHGLRQRAADAERAQHQQAQLAVAAERARISRELHDVVAHSLSVIVAQAQGAAAAIDHHPDRAATALQHVIGIGRDSLAEMRRLLGVIRRDPGPADDPATAPGVAGVPALVDRMCAAGLLVRLSVTGAPASLPAAADLSVYRIVQEALTNSLKHAGPGTTVEVRLVFTSNQVDVDVVDDGRPHATRPTGEGYGLSGIAERVDLLGGDMTVGPLGTAGFQVRARLPVRNGTEVAP